MKQHDFFGMFDHIAFNGDQWLLVQVTHSGHELERVGKIAEILKEHPVPIFTTVEVWAWYPGRRKLDKRYKNKKVWTKNQVFKVIEIFPSKNYVYWMDKKGNEVTFDGEEL